MGSLSRETRKPLGDTELEKGHLPRAYEGRSLGCPDWEPGATLVLLRMQQKLPEAGGWTGP